MRKTKEILRQKWKQARVNIDYHVVFDEHFYSVPHRLVHEEVWIRATESSIEILHASSRVASHVRSRQRAGHTTVREHMPSSHREHAEWSPSRILSWASTIGTATRDLCDAILTERPHPEQGFRSCLGILRLGKRFGEARLDAACARANRAHARSYRHVESILKKGLDRAPVGEIGVSTKPIAHDNVRGPTEYLN